MTLNELIDKAIALRESIPEIADEKVMIFDDDTRYAKMYDCITMVDISAASIIKDKGFDWNGEADYVEEAVEGSSLAAVIWST